MLFRRVCCQELDPVQNIIWDKFYSYHEFKISYRQQNWNYPCIKDVYIHLDSLLKQLVYSIDAITSKESSFEILCLFCRMKTSHPTNNAEIHLRPLTHELSVWYGSVLQAQGRFFDSFRRKFPIKPFPRTSLTRGMKCRTHGDLWTLRLSWSVFHKPHQILLKLTSLGLVKELGLYPQDIGTCYHAIYIYIQCFLEIKRNHHDGVGLQLPSMRSVTCVAGCSYKVSVKGCYKN